MSEHLSEAEGEPTPKTPFSFKLMVALGILYLGWRLVEGIAALIRWLT